MAHANPSGSKFADLPMTSPTNDSGACLTDVYAKRSLKSSQTFFLTAFVCVNAMETPRLHGDMSDPGTGGVFFFLSLERHG